MSAPTDLRVRPDGVRRFGALPAWAEERLAQASLEPLETWGDRLLDVATLAEVLGHPGH